MPSLEELILADETAAEVARASEIAGEEWEKIRVSLALCGDTGAPYSPKCFFQTGRGTTTGIFEGTLAMGFASGYAN